MPNKKGFTLTEIIVVLMIVSILAAIALPNYTSYIQKGAALSAQNNLITIYNAQKNYYLSNGSYCGSSCNTLANINTNLSLNITDSNFTYACTATTGFPCTATGTNVTLTVTNNPVVLTGGASCTTPAGASCNPNCSPNTSTYCP